MAGTGADSTFNDAPLLATSAVCRSGEFPQCDSDVSGAGGIDGLWLAGCHLACRLGRCFANPVRWCVAVADRSCAGHARYVVGNAAKFTAVIADPNPCAIFAACGVGHATLHTGVIGALHKTNHALHLIGAAVWFGGLLPVIYCMRLAKGRWYQQAIYTMMRFSRYGHLAVAVVLLTGIANIFFIHGFSQPRHSAWVQLLLLKCALVGLMVVIALMNRYVLVPRMRQDSRRMNLYFIWMTKIEWAIGGVVLAIVSLFATLEPF